MKYLLDSNVVIDILRNKVDVITRYNIAAIRNNEFFTCPVVYYEVVRGFRGEATKKLSKFLDMCQRWKMLPLDMKAIEQAINIYLRLPRGITIEDNDIYIAAIAMANDCTLVTANYSY